MSPHVYDNYTKTLVEAFIPQAQAGVVFMGVRRAQLLNKVADVEEINRAMAETISTIDLLLAPTLRDGYTFSDIKAKRYMDFINSKIESVLNREQISIIRDYPSISLS